MRKELVLEIGTEEIPARFLPPVLNELKEIAKRELQENRITFGDMISMATPRRIVLCVRDVSEKQLDTKMQILGPPKKDAFNPDGSPTKAALGFAKSQNVDVSEIRVVKTEKGEYAAIEKEIKGEDSKKVLANILPKIILSLSFPKTMRWADLDIRFARPIHWIIAVLSGEVIEFELGNVKSGNKTFGHRFMAPGPIEVKDFNSYKELLRKAYVIVDPEERRSIIQREIDTLASEVGGEILKDDELLETNTFLVEYPVALRGKFSDEYLSLPKEVLVNAMKEHQKYFSVVDKSGNILPYFIAINNTRARDMAVVVTGNERVLKARLADAKFFYEDDKKYPLEKRVERLKDIIFQSKLGSIYDKVLRIEALSEFIAEKVHPELKNIVKRAAYLCKADIVTQMVGEFPKLQGIMGKEYALLHGERRDVADAIREHYLPVYAGDMLPATDAGAILGIADRMDSIVGIFGVGEAPTGAADPYGLRRAALGIIYILLDKKYHLSIKEVVERSIELFNGRIERPANVVKNEVIEFIKMRQKFHLLSQGLSTDITDAVLEASYNDVYDASERVKALSGFKNREDFLEIVTAFKRVINIVQNANPAEIGKEIVKKDLCEEAEKRLFEAYTSLSERMDYLIERRDYESALLELAKIKGPVDTFFNTVLVMCDDLALRGNRLALLRELSRVFLRIADFSRIVT